MRQYTLIFIFTLLVFVTKAQTTTKDFIEACPEMQRGKVYTGKEIRATKKNFPEGTYVAGYGSSKQYPFAKITGDKIIVMFAFEDEYEGEVIYMHAYVYSLKNYQLQQSDSYIYNDGKANSSTTYESTIELSQEGKLIIKEKENGILKTKTYKVGKKRLEYE